MESDNVPRYAYGYNEDMYMRPAIRAWMLRALCIVTIVKIYSPRVS